MSSERRAALLSSTILFFLVVSAVGAGVAQAWICSDPLEAPSQHVDVRVHSDGCSFPVERIKMAERYRSIEAFRTSTPPDENTLNGGKKKGKKKTTAEKEKEDQDEEAGMEEEKLVAKVIEEAKKRLFAPEERQLSQKYFAISTKMAEMAYKKSSEDDPSRPTPRTNSKEQEAIALKRHVVRKISGIVNAANFSKCCTLHDACYSLCNIGRQTCEDRFSACLREQCNSLKTISSTDSNNSDNGGGGAASGDDTAATTTTSSELSSSPDKDLCHAYATDVAEVAITSDYSKKQFDMIQKEACYCVEHESAHEGLITAANSLIDHLHPGTEEEKIHHDHPKTQALVKLTERFEAMHKYAVKAHKKKFTKELYPKGIPDDSRAAKKKYEEDKRDSLIQRNEELSRKMAIHFLDSYVYPHPEGIVHTKERFLPGSHMDQEKKKMGSGIKQKRSDDDDSDGAITDEL